MVIKLQAESPAITKNTTSPNRDFSLEDKELKVRQAYTQRIELLLTSFLDSLSDKEFANKEMIMDEFKLYFREAAFQISEVWDSLFDKGLKSRIDKSYINSLENELLKILDFAIVEDKTTSKFKVDQNILTNIITSIFTDYVSEERYNPEVDTLIDWKKIIDAQIAAWLWGLQKKLKEDVKSLWWNRMFFDKLNKWKWSALWFPVLLWAWMSALMTWSLAKFWLVYAELMWVHNIPDSVQTAISYSLWALAWVWVANMWVKAWRRAEEVSYLDAKWFSTKNDKRKLAISILAASWVSIALMWADFWGIVIRWSQWYDVANQIKWISDKVNGLIQFDRTNINPNTSLELQRAYWSYIAWANQVYSWINWNIAKEQASWNWPATQAHSYAINWLNATISGINNAPWNNNTLKSDLTNLVNNYDVTTRVKLSWQFGDKSWLIPWMIWTRDLMANRIESSVANIKAVEERFLKTIRDYENSSWPARLFKEVFLGTTIDMDVRDVDRYQKEVLEKIKDLQEELNKMNLDTEEAIKSYNELTKLIDQVASWHYKRSPLPLTNVSFPWVDLSWVSKVASEVPPAQATSAMEYWTEMEKIVWSKEISDSIKHWAMIRLLINLALLAYPVFISLWIPAFRSWRDKKKWLKWNNRQYKFTKQEEDFERLMNSNLDNLEKALAPLVHIFPWYKPLNRQELEALFIDFLRDEYAWARVLPQHGKNKIEKTWIWLKNFANNFFFHDTRTNRELEVRWLNEAIMDLRVDNSKRKKDKKVYPSQLDSSSAPIKADTIKPISLDRLWEKLLPKEITSSEGIDLYDLLEKLFNAKDVYWDIVDKRTREIDERDEDILKARFEELSQEFTDVKKEILAFFDWEENMSELELRNMKEIELMVYSINESWEFKTRVINEFESKVKLFCSEWYNFIQSDDYKNEMRRKLSWE